MFKCLGFLSSFEKSFISFAVEQHQIQHTWVVRKIASVPLFQNIIQIQSDFYGNVWRFGLCKYSVAMFDMLKAKNNIPHIPMDPVLLSPIANESIKSLEKGTFDIVVSFFDVGTKNAQVFGHSVNSEADSLPGQKMHNYN